MKIISVHLPKTAGTSFRRSLEEHLGEDLHLDYSTPPLHYSEKEQQNLARRKAEELSQQAELPFACLHGHFMPYPFLHLKEKHQLKFVSWLREPFERLVSHFHFWIRNYNPKTAGPKRKQVVEENWTLEQFCLSPHFKNIYSKYLWQTPLKEFDFIGITEFFTQDLQAFNKSFFNSASPPHRLNVSKSSDRPEFSNTILREKVRQFHSLDYELYEEALELRKARLCSPDH